MKTIIRRQSLLLAVLLNSAAMSFALNAHAETAGDTAAAAANLTGVTEVIVTAQKRLSTVQTTAASIAAVSGEDLKARGITSVADLAQATPGVSLDRKSVV